MQFYMKFFFFSDQGTDSLESWPYFRNWKYALSELLSFLAPVYARKKAITSSCRENLLVPFECKKASE